MCKRQAEKGEGENEGSGKSCNIILTGSLGKIKKEGFLKIHGH